MSAPVLVGIGLLGGLGAVLRFLLDGAVARRAGRTFPFGTLAVNLSGALALGVLAGAGVAGDRYLLWGVGLIGAFTTFSTWMFESQRLAEDGDGRSALFNLVVSLAAGLAIVLLGRHLGGLLSPEALRLTVHVGERARTDRGFMVDALIDIAARHRLRTSLVLRGAEGFGAHHRLRTDRLLSLSEDLPLVVVAVDEPARVRAALADVQALPHLTGLVTLERAHLPGDDLGAADVAPGATRLTVYLGRRERVAGVPPTEAVVDLLHGGGVAGATVLLGVDGTMHGERQRARFFAANARVPSMVVAIGDGERIAAVLPELDAVLDRPLVTLERVRICKRDGVALAGPHLPSPTDAPPDAGGRLTVFSSETSRHDGRPLHRELVRALRAAGAPGATTLRGTWGYHGDHAPHGDALLQLRRRVPVVTTIVDAPAAIARWFAIVDAVTDRTGLVISEPVPLRRVLGPGG